MNLSSTLPVATSRFSLQQIRLRWAVVTVGVVVNAAILLPTLTQPKPIEALASATYLPPANPARSSPVPAAVATAQTPLARADALAQAGYRDAAVEQYLEAMTEYVKSQSR